MSPDSPAVDEAVEAAAIAAGAEVLSPHDQATEQSVLRQINAMYQRDRWMAVALVVALLVVIPFIYIALWDFMPNAGTKVILFLSGALLLLYNVASMIALIRNYRRDRDFIYRRDVAHLRELRAARQALEAKR